MGRCMPSKSFELAGVNEALMAGRGLGSSVRLGNSQTVRLIIGKLSAGSVAISPRSRLPDVHAGSRDVVEIIT